MRGFDYLIVGGGLAAVSAVDGIRELHPDASIAILSDETEPPYQRPPLSKEFLQYPDVPRSLLYVKPEGWYDEQASLQLVTRQKAMTLDPGAMRVTTARGTVYGAPRILLATGGRAKNLAVAGRDLPGVFTLRDVEDSEAIRAAGIEGTEAVLIGAGFVGMELAASLSAHGVSSTVVEALDRAWPRLLPPELARWVAGYFEERGVSFRFNAAVEGFVGEEKLEAVLAGGRSIPCDFAVVGVGMDPCDGLASDAGLAVDDGIQVDAFGETSHPHIYAAGDVARFPDPVFGGRTRVEHWEHAREHGRRVGRNMTGERVPYDHLSHLFSRVFDLNVNVVGRPAAASEIVRWGEPGEGPSVTFGLAEGRVSGVVLLDAPAELEHARTLVRSRAAANLLGDPVTRDFGSLDGIARLAAANAMEDQGIGEEYE